MVWRVRSEQATGRTKRRELEGHGDDNTVTRDGGRNECGVSKE